MLVWVAVEVCFMACLKDKISIVYYGLLFLCHISRMIFTVQFIITIAKSRNLYFFFMFWFINIKNVSFFFTISANIQNNEIIIIKVNGKHNILYLKEFKIFPLNNSIVDRPIPQPGHGIPVTNLNTQWGMLFWNDKLSKLNKAKYPQKIAKIINMDFANILRCMLVGNLCKSKKVFFPCCWHYQEPVYNPPKVETSACK